ncbi:hypothetical protein ACFWWA_35735 [Streptomyces goshikiensis]|uniref:hypothetical protein n=1 Tax=Streptomyces goshikiensis TaxID=1942 RepID=UPI00364AB9E0
MQDPVTPDIQPAGIAQPCMHTPGDVRVNHDKIETSPVGTSKTGRERRTAVFLPQRSHSGNGISVVAHPPDHDPSPPKKHLPLPGTRHSWPEPTGALMSALHVVHPDPAPHHMRCFKLKSDELWKGHASTNSPAAGLLSRINESAQYSTNLHNPRSEA